MPIVTAFQAAHAYAEVRSLILRRLKYMQFISPRLQDIRSRMREMGSRAGVPIEPPEQTELLNACIAQPGVVGCGVPGGVFCFL